MIKFILNNQNVSSDLPSGTTVLDFVRYHQHLTGTKIGCREGDCGACTILVGELKDGKVRYRSMTSCLMPLGNAYGKHIVTVEGINDVNLTPVQKAIVEEGGTQCGFCTIGFVMSFTGFCLNAETTDLKTAIAAVDGNICRCTGYKSLERAAGHLSKLMQQADQNDKISWLVNQKIIPDYFLSIKNRLQEFTPNTQSSIHGKVKEIFVGGGTDLFVQRPEDMVQTQIAHVFERPELNTITEENGYCQIGGSCTATDILESTTMSQHFERLPQFMKLVSSTPIRNMGTLAGNLVNASPIGDLTIFFLALDSDLLLNHKGQKRQVKLRHFYKGYKTFDKAADEIVEGIRFKLPETTSSHFNFEKVCKRTHLDIASVNSACQITLQDGIITSAHLSAGGVAAIPKYLEQSSAALIGQSISHETLQKVSAIIQEEVTPISDARGTADYKRLLLRQLFYAHFLEFFPEQLSLAQLA